MSPARRIAAGLLGLPLVGVAACSSGGDGDAETGGDTEAAPISVTVPVERQTPFCEAMIALSDRLATDPPEDETAYIISVYTDIADEVPLEIRDDFDAVLAGLQGEAPPPPVDADTTLPITPVESIEQFDAEGRGPDDDPASRLNAYVDFACRDSANNPGPPATQPQDGAPDTSADG